MNYDSRLQRLEARVVPVEAPRMLVEFVDQSREVQTILANDQWFHREGSELESAFIDRARATAGWA